MLVTSLEVESSVALVEGYRIAGKTGTSQISGKSGYIPGAYSASFMGLYPGERSAPIYQINTIALRSELYHHFFGDLHFNFLNLGISFL